MLAKLNFLCFTQIVYQCQWLQSIFGKPSCFNSGLSATPRELHGHRAIQLIKKIVVYNLEVSLTVE